MARQEDREGYLGQQPLLRVFQPMAGWLDGRMDGWMAMVSSVPDHIPSRSSSWLCCSLCV